MKRILGLLLMLCGVPALGQIYGSPSSGVTQKTNEKWSGYVVTGPEGSVTDVRGSWLVPQVTCGNGGFPPLFWVGIDGYNQPNVKSPGQIGTGAVCGPKGPEYYAWYEFPYQLGQQTIEGFEVKAGDVITASVHFNVNGGTFTATIEDGAQSKTVESQEIPTARPSSAEWTVERLSFNNPVTPFDTTFFGEEPLSILEGSNGSTPVTGTCYATVGRKTGPISDFEHSQSTAVFELTLTDVLTNASLAIPSALSPDGSSFYVQSTAGLVSWWPADGNYLDIMGRNNGTGEGEVTFRPGEFGQAFSLDGGRYVDVGSLNLPITFTVDAWMNPKSTTSPPNPFCQGCGPQIVNETDGVPQNSYYFQIEPAGTLALSVESEKGFTQYRTSRPVVTTDGAWQHVATTCDGGARIGQKIQFFVNGISCPTSVIGPVGRPGEYDAGGTPLVVSLSTKIGAWGDGVDGLFNGLIDEVQILSRVLNASEIRAMYNAGPQTAWNSVNKTP
jgi:hypothetical protein